MLRNALKTSPSAIHRRVGALRHAFSDAHIARRSHAKYRFCIIRADGSTEYDTIAFKDLLVHGIQARDLMPLELKAEGEGERDTQEERLVRASARSVILTRPQFLAASIGYLKCVAYPDRVIVFDPDRDSVMAWIDSFSATLAASRADELAYDANTACTEAEIAGFESPGGCGQHDNEAAAKGSAEGVDFFPLIVLEDMLLLQCEMFERRMRLISPLCGSILSLGEGDPEVHLQKVISLSDALRSFQFHVEESARIVANLLRNDEDLDKIAGLSGLSHEAEVTGHDEVERMLQTYSGRLMHITYRVRYELKRLQSRQDGVQFAAALQRNKVLKLNLHMSVATVSMGALAVVGGTFGMNLESGLETTPHLFNTVVAAMTVGGAASYFALNRYINSHLSYRNIQEKAASLEAMRHILDNLMPLDLALKEAFHRIDNPKSQGGVSRSGLSRDEFAGLLSSATSRINEQDTVAFFDLLDIDKDGMLEKGEIQVPSDKKKAKVRSD